MYTEKVRVSGFTRRLKMQNENERVVEQGAKGLKKVKMSPWSIAFIIYCLVAAGAFGVEEMIPVSGPGMTIIILIVMPVIWAVPICLQVSELSTFMPAVGGPYVWVKEALGEMWGFCSGWWGALSIYLSSATYVVMVVGYASKFLDLTPTSAMAIKVGMILIFTIVNLLGVKEVGAIDTILSIVILAGFALITVVGFANWEYNPVSPVMPENTTIIDCLGGSICISIWMYCGYACVSNMGGEIENPKAIPRGFLIALPLITISYVLPVIAGLASVGNWERWGLEGENIVGFSDVLTNNLGTAWGVLFIILAIVGQCAIFNSYMAAGPRSFFALADDHLMPEFMVKLSKKRGAPYVPILILAAFTMIMMNFDFTVLLVFVAPHAIMAYVLIAISYFILRKKYPVEQRINTYYVKGGKPAALLITACPIIIGCIALLVNGTEYFLLGFVSIFSGLIMYLICKWSFGGLYKNDPEKYPINPKTKLAAGDIKKIAGFIFVFAVYAFIGSLFLGWYEGATGPEYYKAVYGQGLVSNFALMINIAEYGGLAGMVIGAVMYVIGRKKD